MTDKVKIRATETVFGERETETKSTPVRALP